MTKEDDTTFYVYIYLDPRKLGNFTYSVDGLGFIFTCEPFYIGKGKNKRIYAHLTEGNNKPNKDKHNRIRDIKKELNINPVILTIKSNMLEVDAFKLERLFIKKIGRADLGKGPLLNLNDGGAGGSSPSSETIEKIRKSLIGKYVGENSPSYGKEKTLEHKKKSSDTKNSYKKEIQDKINELKDILSINELNKLIENFKKEHSLSSIYFGVYFIKRSNKYVASILYKGKKIETASFKKEINAAIAYNKKSFELFGIEARLNNINDWSVIDNQESSVKTSKYIGVSHRKASNRWEANITSNKKVFHLGSFLKETDAAIVYNRKSFELFGEKAKLNLIDNWQNIQIQKKKKKTSKYIGVSYSNGNRKQKWQASIRINNERIFLGRFISEKDAAFAYNNFFIKNNINR